MIDIKIMIQEPIDLEIKKHLIPKVRLKIGAKFVNIFLNDLIHLGFIRSDFHSFQTWKEGHNDYRIEYYFIKGKPVLTQYDNKELWEAILKEICKLT